MYFTNLEKCQFSSSIRSNYLWFFTCSFLFYLETMNVLRLISPVLFIYYFFFGEIFYWNIKWTEKRCYFRRKKQLYYPLSRIATSAQADFLLRLARMLGGTHKVWSEKKKLNRELFSVFVCRYTLVASTLAHTQAKSSLSANGDARAWPRNASNTQTHTSTKWFGVAAAIFALSAMNCHKFA